MNRSKLPAEQSLSGGIEESEEEEITVADVGVEEEATQRFSPQPSEDSSHFPSQPRPVLVPPAPPDVFFRLPDTYANWDPDDLMDEDTDEEELIGELDEEMELDETDMKAETDFKEILEARYNIELSLNALL